MPVRLLYLIFWQAEQLARSPGSRVEPSVLEQAQERWERDLRATAEHLRRLLDERPGA